MIKFIIALLLLCAVAIAHDDPEPEAVDIGPPNPSIAETQARVKAWQVFLEDMPLSDETRKTFNDILKECDEDDFRIRLNAQAKLEKPDMFLAMLKVFREPNPPDLSPEQHLRIDCASSAFHILPKEDIEVLKTNRVFLQGCAMDPDPALRAIAQKYLDKLPPLPATQPSTQPTTEPSEEDVIPT